MRSDKAVDPLTSMNSIDMGTSAPPGNSREAISHRLQKRGFSADCCFPNSNLTIVEPMPLNGALQNLQRGSSGRILKMCRRRLSTANAFVVNQNHHTLPTSTPFRSLLVCTGLYLQS